MPKSRGRKHPKSTRRPQPRPTSWQAALVKVGRTLRSPDSDRASAELFASGLLGTVWADRDIGDRDILDSWLHDLLGYVTTRRSPEAAALLAALRTVLSHPAVDAELADWGAPLLADVPWASAPAPLPVRASRSSDVWNEVTAWFLEYDDEVLNVIQRRWASGAVGTLASFTPAVLEVWDDETARSDGEMGARVAVPVEDAVATLLAAQHMTEMTWPPSDDEDYVQLGHLLAARLAAVGVAPAEEPEWEPMSEEAKDALIERFLADDQELKDDDGTREILDACLWYGDSYMYGGALAWSPIHVELFLLDWLPRKTFLEPEVRRLVPTVTYAWTGWAM